MHELFVTPRSRELAAPLVQQARDLDVPITLVTERAVNGLSETVTPQGIVAVCDLLDRPLETVLTEDALAGPASLVVVLVDVSDPGNAGTVIRVADAAGANAVILAGDSVDPHNGKCVRAAAGSLFHVPIARVRDVGAVLGACAERGLRTQAAHGYAEAQLDMIDLALPSAWIFGNETHGLPPAVLAGVDIAVRIPIYGEAESLNLATAAAVCVYASALAAHRS